MKVFGQGAFCSTLECNPPKSTKKDAVDLPTASPSRVRELDTETGRPRGPGRPKAEFKKRSP